MDQSGVVSLRNPFDDVVDVVDVDVLRSLEPDNVDGVDGGVDNECVDVDADLFGANVPTSDDGPAINDRANDDDGVTQRHSSLQPFLVDVVATTCVARIGIDRSTIT
jgi:hypothetical protein